MIETVFEKITGQLTHHSARFRVVNHPAAGRSEEVAAVRGTQMGQGAKALVCHLKKADGKSYVLAVLAADLQADLKKLAEALGAKKVSLASPAEVLRLTGCVPGAIPPFSLHPELELVVDPALFDRFDEIAFNAGSLERSVILNAQDYLSVTCPERIHFARTTEDK
ncbi:YbaK/prolyl-tRNA synthetase associated domain-containing protein [Yersinia intermedia]|uniref:YbaK/prolyl-tRNA synthetase associated domain-containing protein n=1 Tax=Yersinia intermedia TaxID=631 RepID=UPI0030CFAC71